MAISKNVTGRARAGANFALIKYWGKADARLNVPAVGSISITLAELWSETEVVLDAALAAELEPWYRAAVQQDAEARRVAAALLAGDDPDGDATDPRAFMRSVFRDGLLPAIRTDPVVLRAFVRSLNLLTAPDALVTDPDVGARVLAAGPWDFVGQVELGHAQADRVEQLEELAPWIRK